MFVRIFKGQRKLYWSNSESASKKFYKKFIHDRKSAFQKTSNKNYFVIAICVNIDFRYGR